MYKLKLKETNAPKSDEKDVIMIADRILNLGLVQDKKVKMHIAGDFSLDEILDTMNTGLYEILNTYVEYGAHKHNLSEEDQKKLKRDVYERAVFGFSLTIDKFFPEGKDTKFQGLTEEAIMKAQNEILSSKQK